MSPFQIDTRSETPQTTPLKSALVTSSPLDLLGSLTYGRTRRPWLPMADLLAQALVVGWVFGRLGCTLVHDHIGT